MKNLCDSANCPHGKSRETCDTLCPEAEEYANMDYVGYEKAFNIHGVMKWKGAGLFRDSEDPRERVKAIQLFHRQGKSYEDISIHLECDEDFIREVLEDD